MNNQTALKSIKLSTSKIRKHSIKAAEESKKLIKLSLRVERICKGEVI